MLTSSERFFWRQSVEPHLRDALAALSKRLEEFFEYRELTVFEKSASGPAAKLIPIKRAAFFAKNTKAFVDFIMKERSFSRYLTIVKLGVDRGQVFFQDLIDPCES